MEHDKRICSTSIFPSGPLKCNKNASFSFKNTQNKENDPLLSEKLSFFCYAGGCPYFLNKALDKVYG